MFVNIPPPGLNHRPWCLFYLLSTQYRSPFWSVDKIFFPSFFFVLSSFSNIYSLTVYITAPSGGKPLNKSNKTTKIQRESVFYIMSRYVLGVLMFCVCMLCRFGAPVMKCEVILLISSQLLKGDVHLHISFCCFLCSFFSF